VPSHHAGTICRGRTTEDGETVRGAGLELREHADTLRVLRWANNNPNVLSLFSDWRSGELAEEKKDADPARAKRITDMENRGSNDKDSSRVYVTVNIAK
jgi:nucleolar protein 4